MSIQLTVQQTPNPNSVKITASESIFAGPGSTSLKRGEKTDHPLAQALVEIEGVDNIFGMNDFVTVSKEPEADWEEIIPKVEAIFNKL